MPAVIVERDGQKFRIEHEDMAVLEAEIAKFEAESLRGPGAPAPQQQPQQAPAQPGPASQFGVQQEGEIGPQPLPRQAALAQREYEANALLTEGDKAAIRNLKELQQIDPSQAEGAQRQIDTIMDRRLQNRTLIGDVAGAAVTAGDVAQSLITNAVAEPVAGVMGLFNLIRTGDVDRASNTIDYWKELIGTELKTDKAKEVMESVAAPFQAYESFIEGRAAALSGGNPTAAAAIYTLGMGWPELLGVKTGVTRGLRNMDIPDADGALRAISNERREMMNWLKRNNINMTGYGWKEEAVRIANQVAPENRINELDNMVNGVRAARNASKKKLDDAFEQARNGPRAWVNTGDAARMAQDVRTSLLNDGFDMKDMVRLNQRLDELTNMANELPTGAKAADGVPFQNVNLTMYEMVRRRIARDLRDNLDPSEAKALQRLRNGFDEFVDQGFNNAMIRGSEEAISNWKNARALAAEHAERFTSNRALRQLIDREATPTDIRNWILGASDALPPGRAVELVKRIEEIAPESMGPLRDSFTRGLLEPLLKTEANPRRFLDQIQTFQNRYGDELMESLGYNMGELKNLERIVRAGVKHGTEGPWAMLNLHTAISRFLFGHGIAKRGQFVRMMTAGSMYSTGKILGARQRAMFREALDGLADPKAGPMFNRGETAAAMVFTQDAMERMGVEASPEQIESAVAYGEQAQTIMGLREQAEKEKAQEAQQRQQQTGQRAAPQATAAATLNNPNQVSPRFVPGETAGAMAALTGSSNNGSDNDHGAEGFEPLPYRVKGQGKETIGHGLELDTIAERDLNEEIGRSVEDIRENGVTPNESRQMASRYLAQNDVKFVKAHREYADLPQTARDVVRELGYWAGASGALKFKDMWAALKDGDYAKAAEELMDSQTVWGTGSRPKDLWNREEAVRRDRGWAFDRMVRLAEQLKSLEG